MLIMAALSLNNCIRHAFKSKCAKNLYIKHCQQSLSSERPTWKTLLSEEFPGVPQPIYASATASNQETQVTTLSNGLRVASQNKFGQYCTVGVVIDSGSRYEVRYPSGISHFLEKLAFSSTDEFEDKHAILHEVERHGGICDCQGNRDTLIYAASADSRKLKPVVKLLSEAVLRPKLTEEEIENARLIIQFELEDIQMKPDQEQVLMEIIHAAAYRDNTLGLPKLCPQENVALIDRGTLFTYLKHHFTPSRMVLAGVGIDHNSLVEAANKHFVEKPAIWDLNPNLVTHPEMKIDNSISQFTGGMIKIEKDMASISHGPSPMPELAHFVLGLESTSHQHPDFVPFCVLNTMMGGGGSFSAGGPGKGMYTRLYTNVLNRHHWMYSATAYNQAYADSGLFYIHASAPPSQLKQLVSVIVNEFKSMCGNITKAELDRAKTQLQSMLLMNLESRPVVFEDIGRQVLATGIRRQPEYFIEEIAKVSDEDIYRITTKMLKCKAAVAALGNLKQLPTLREIDADLVSKDQPKTRRFSLFSSS